MVAVLYNNTMARDDLQVIIPVMQHATRVLSVKAIIAVDAVSADCLTVRIGGPVAEQNTFKM